MAVISFPFLLDAVSFFSSWLCLLRCVNACPVSWEEEDTGARTSTQPAAAAAAQEPGMNPDQQRAFEMAACASAWREDRVRLSQASGSLQCALA